MTMQSLIERLEAATGADRELDIAICDALNIDCQECCGVGGPITGFRGEPIGGTECCGNFEINPPDFTSSIDAALTLMPEGCWWEVIQRTSPDSPLRSFGAGVLFSAGVGSFGGQHVGNGYHDDPNIALCIAAIRVRCSLSSPDRKSSAPESGDHPVTDQ